MPAFHLVRFCSPAALPISLELSAGGSPGLSQLGDGVTVGVAGAVVCACAPPAGGEDEGQGQRRNDAASGKHGRTS